MYEYEALVDRVIDGDTISVSIDVGFSLTYKTYIRLYGINTPEIRGEQRDDGLRVKNFVEMELSGADVKVKTYKPDKYGGRYIGEVFYRKGSEDWCNLNKLLLSEGMATEYYGKGKKS